MRRRHQAASDELVSRRRQIGDRNRPLQAPGRPVDQLGLFARPDLRGPPGVRRIDRVAVRRFLGEGRDAGPGRLGDVAQGPPACAADRQEQGGRGGGAPEGEASFPRFPRLDQTGEVEFGRNGLPGDGRQGLAQPVAVVRIGLDPGGDLGVMLQVRGHLGRTLRTERPVDIGLQVLLQDRSHRHFTLLKCAAAGARPASSSRSRSRARESRDITVPTGTPSALAVSV